MDNGIGGALGLTLAPGIVALVFAFQTLPIWFAAKVVGAGHAGFIRVGLALLGAGVLAWILAWALGGWGLVLMPVVFVSVFKVALDTSFLGAFILCILGVAFQVAITKALSILF